MAHGSDADRAFYDAGMMDRTFVMNGIPYRTNDCTVTNFTLSPPFDYYEKFAFVITHDATGHIFGVTKTNRGDHETAKPHYRRLGRVDTTAFIAAYRM